MISEDQALEVFKTLADANRLQLFKLLLYSDHTNSELMEKTQLSQNLLSHHLNVLSSAGLIHAHRSIGDARRHYYGANFDMVCAFIAWWKVYTFCSDSLPERVDNPPHVLFLCLRNSTRSLLAEALASHTMSGLLRITSAGIEEGGKIEAPMLHVLGEHGIPADGLNPVVFDTIPPDDYDYVITVCDIVHETGLPESLDGVEHIHWSLFDPVESSLDENEQIALTRQLYRDISMRLRAFAQNVFGNNAQPA